MSHSPVPMTGYLSNRYLSEMIPVSVLLPLYSVLLICVGYYVPTIQTSQIFRVLGVWMYDIVCCYRHSDTSVNDRPMDRRKDDDTESSKQSIFTDLLLWEVYTLT